MRLGSKVSAPISVQAGWPSALAAIGEPSFAEVVEHTCPGTPVAWLSAWPKLLWYLGKSDPSLSTFLLSLLLELAKLASRSGGIHEHLLAAICPLLAPFLCGRRSDGAEEPPPLAQLPRGLAGAQGLAAAVLPHFPKMSDAFVTALTKLVCRWSDIGISDDRALTKPVVGLGVDSCELILESLLTAGSKREQLPLPTRLRIVLTILCAAPGREVLSIEHAARAEMTALRLADALAGWLMSRHTYEGSDFPSGSSLNYDDCRRLALQSFAWPLCVQGLACAPAQASRMLCFLFFCAVRLPNLDDVGGNACSSSSADLGWRAFLSTIFDSFLGEGLCTGGGKAVALFTISLCDPARGLMQGSLAVPAPSSNLMCDDYTDDVNNLQGASARRLGQLFVTVCMKSVAASQKPAAYELLVKLCVAGLVGLPDSSAEQQRKAKQIVSLLAAAIACRNELSLATTGWGSEGPASFPNLVVARPEALRSEIMPQLQRLSIDGPSLDEMKAMLPLL